VNQAVSPAVAAGVGIIAPSFAFGGIGYRADYTAFDRAYAMLEDAKRVCEPISG
jgi:hypothetical protein